MAQQGGKQPRHQPGPGHGGTPGAEAQQDRQHHLPAERTGFAAQQRPGGAVPRRRGRIPSALLDPAGGRTSRHPACGGLKPPSHASGRFRRHQPMLPHHGRYDYHALPNGRVYDWPGGATPGGLSRPEPGAFRLRRGARRRARPRRAAARRAELRLARLRQPRRRLAAARAVRPARAARLRAAQQRALRLLRRSSSRRSGRAATRSSATAGPTPNARAACPRPRSAR